MDEAFCKKMEEFCNQVNAVIEENNKVCENGKNLLKQVRAARLEDYSTEELKNELRRRHEL